MVADRVAASVYRRWRRLLLLLCSEWWIMSHGLGLRAPSDTQSGEKSGQLLDPVRYSSPEEALRVVQYFPNNDTPVFGACFMALKH